MPNFTPHLSCVAILPDNTLATEYARCLPLKSVGDCEKVMGDATN